MIQKTTLLLGLLLVFVAACAQEPAPQVGTTAQGLVVDDNVNTDLNSQINDASAVLDEKASEQDAQEANEAIAAEDTDTGYDDELFEQSIEELQALYQE